MLYAHVHRDDTLMPEFVQKPACEHEWLEEGIDESLKNHGVIGVYRRCQKCGKTDIDWRDAGQGLPS